MSAADDFQARPQISELEQDYWGLKAQTWDLFHGGETEWLDRDFFLDFIRRSGQPALDVGCGTGRLLLDYRELGLDIDGVDSSSEMLGLCRGNAAKRGLDVTVFLQDVRFLRLPRRYKAIIVPSATFQVIIDPNAAVRAMSCLFDGLLPGGALMVSFAEPCADESTRRNLDETWKLAAEAEDVKDGSVYRLWSKQKFDFEAQLEYLESRYECWRDRELTGSEYHRQSPANRWYKTDQARRLFLDRGFVEVEEVPGSSLQTGRFTGQTFYVSGRRR